jgi:hypothetical protein
MIVKLWFLTSFRWFFPVSTPNLELLLVEFFLLFLTNIHNLVFMGLKKLIEVCLDHFVPQILDVECLHIRSLADGSLNKVGELT